MTQQEFTNRYQFNLREDKIGGGSFGTVYKAYDNVLDREVAIKVSEVKYVGDKEFSLLEEFKAIESLPAHKNIANYEEVFRFESFQGVFDYGLMQYYPLGNLSEYLKNNNLKSHEKEQLIFEILDGVDFLHQYKVVQRDLKPSNILVVLNRKNKLIPKITDFGLSKQAETDAKGSRFTNSFAGGTLQYSSPEQLKGLPLKLNTDLWSFGVIVYEILTGKTLFEAQSISTASAEWQNEITQLILNGNYKNKIENVSEKWQRLLRVCIERDVYKRVKDAKQIREHFETDKLRIAFSKETPLEKFSDKQINDFTKVANVVTEGDNNNIVENEGLEKLPKKNDIINKNKQQSSNKNNADTLISEKTEDVPNSVVEQKQQKEIKKERKKIDIPKKQLKLAGIFIAAVLLIVLMINLLPTEEERWEKASAVNTLDSFESYLNKHPNGKWKIEAINKLYFFAVKENTIETYQSLLSKYPNTNAKNQLDKLVYDKNKKEFDSLIFEGNKIFALANTYYKEKNITKCAESLKKAKEYFNNASNNYDINDDNAIGFEKLVIDDVNKYITQQEKDKTLNPSQKSIYNKNINILKKALN